MKTFSITMASYNRADLLANTLRTIQTQTRQPYEIIVVEDGYDGGKTVEVCRAFHQGDPYLPVRYIRRTNRPDMPYSNAAIPRNIGIRAAVGDILIIQNPEVRFTKPTDLENIVGPVEADASIACCAPCEGLKSDGSHERWLCDPKLWNYNHFCMAVERQRIFDMGGFDEQYIGYGWDDHEFNWRLQHSGMTFQWAKDVITQHQWHEVRPSPRDAENARLNSERCATMSAEVRAGKRTVEANIGRDWGNVDS